MPTPPKPYLVLTDEKKSHRTKDELEQRKQGEAALATGKALRERSEVKDNPDAHKEFTRINKLLKKINKNDALFEPIVNRYCTIQSECIDLEERREEFHGLLRLVRETLKSFSDEMTVEEKTEVLFSLTNDLGKITTAMNNIDGLIQTKRKMLLDIEKENIFTIASALRSIPKKTESKQPSKMAAMLEKQRQAN